MTNLKKNFIYNITYQILILIIPLITAPYIARTLGVEGIGAYSYTYSIVYYFMLFTLLGVNNYGNRTIAKVKDNKEELSKKFWSIYFLQLVMGILMIVIYIMYIYLFNIKYKSIAIISIFFIISAILDINWFFFGIEEFKKTIIRNIFVKIISLICIFIFVKSKNDLWKYTLIMAITNCISQLILFIFLKEKIKFVKVTFKDIFSHIKFNLILFIPVIAVSLYKMMDKIMLGQLANISEVGYYENAEKIINIPQSIITALGTVMLPRISNLVANNDLEKVKDYIYKSIKFIMFLSFPMCLGLVAIAYEFAPLYFGVDFQKTGILISLLSPTLIFFAFANVIRTQYLIPFEKDKIYIKSVILGAFVNLIANWLLIPTYKSIGACIGTILAEFTVFFYQSFYIRKDILFSPLIKDIILILIKTVIMFAAIYPINYIKSISSMIRILIQVSIALILYAILNIRYIKSTINLNIKK